MDQYDPQRQAALIAALLGGGGTQVRGPTGPERFGEAMNQFGLPGSFSLSEMEANPLGFAAIGRGMFGSAPNDRVRRGFDMLNQRTVKPK